MAGKSEATCKRDCKPFSPAVCQGVIRMSDGVLHLLLRERMELEVGHQHCELCQREPHVK